MKYLETPLKGLTVIQLIPFQDERGQFIRLFCDNEFKEIGHVKKIVQINQSLTKRNGAVRGLHFQFPPKAEIKVIKCFRGTVFDVAVDLRKHSPTFLKWYGEILSAENMKMVYIPEGFAHGFQAMEENSELLYLHTEFYNPEHEGGIRYDDPIIDIKWPLEITEISVRDKNFKLIDKDFKGLDL